MIKIESHSLRQLKAKFENRQFAIPEIQRQYVWNRQRICNLMDSILKNYPIGVSLVWNAPYSKAIDIRPNNKSILPPFDKGAKTADLIIDGQQRLSTLYGILMGIEPKSDAGSEINFKHLFFSCDKNASKRFKFSKSMDEDTKGYIRLFELVNMKQSSLRKRLRLTASETKEAVKCHTAFAKYKFFTIKFTGLEFNDVRDIFIRINSAGMSVNRADTLFAKATDVKLRHHIIEAQRGLNHGFDSISTNALQSALVLAYGAERIDGREFDAFVRKIEKSKNATSEFSKTWKKMLWGYQETVDFLVTQLKVKHPKLLPYTNIYTMLAFFFYLNNSRAKLHQIREIKKWFWHTACGERYSGAAFNRNIPEDIRFFKKLVKSPNTKYSISERINPTDFLKSDYSKASSSSVAYFLFLRCRKPLYLANGQEMIMDNASAISNRKDRHHIFPKALLRRKEINFKWINALPNICYLESDKNTSIRDSAPSKYLGEYRTKKHFGRVMRSHLIPFDLNAPVWTSNIKTGYLDFFNKRGSRILGAIEELAGAKIFERFEGIRRL